jgi:hypothetical protein
LALAALAEAAASRAADAEAAADADAAAAAAFSLPWQPVTRRAGRRDGRSKAANARGRRMGPGLSTKCS